MTSLSLAVVLAEPARRNPDKVAVIEGDERVTYAQRWEESRRYAAALASRGVTPGTRVGLMAPNVIDFVRAYYGILTAGAVVVPVPTLLQAEETAFLMSSSGARALLFHPSFAAVATAAAESAGIDAWSVAGFGDDADPLPTYVSREAEDPAVIFYTSGTTGRPKGAMLTNVNLVLNATVNALDCGHFGPDDVVLGALPLFHIFGQSVALNGAFRIGATLVLLPRFEPQAALRLMDEERVTMCLGVPTMYVQMLQVADEVDPHLSVHSAVSGGASLPVAVLEAFQKRFPPVTIYEGYGLSETSPTATTNQPWAGTKAGSIGHPVWGVDVEIADDAVEDRIVLLGAGERGEVVIRGHCVFAGYLDNPEATRAAMVDGWFRSGDIGLKDEQGFIYIVDRKKDLVIRGGFNVYPREVEEVLMQYPGVQQVAVIGIPDSERGEEVCAVVVPAEGGAVDGEELIAWSREQLGRHKYPRRVEVVEELPLGPSHKVLKRELRSQFAGPFLTRSPSRSTNPEE